MEAATKFKTVDEYIVALPPQKRKLIKELRKTIKQAAPQAEEAISYNMPAFKLHGMLLYYAAHKEHIGFYPFSSTIAAFQKELAAYKQSKGTVQFPFDESLPLELISKMVTYRINENIAKAETKTAKKKSK